MKRFFTTSGTNNLQTNVHPTILCFRVLGLFRTFHVHTTTLNAHLTIFRLRVLGLFRTLHHTPRCSTPTPLFFFPRVLGLFASFGFVSNIPRIHHDFISAKLEHYKNGGFDSKLEFIKYVPFYVSYQPNL